MARNGKSIKDKLINSILTIVVMAGLAGIGDGVYEQMQTSAVTSQNHALLQRSITLSNRHHSQIQNAGARQVALEEEVVGLQKQLLVAEEATDAVVSSHSAELQDINSIKATLASIESQINALIAEEQAQSSQP